MNKIFLSSLLMLCFGCSTISKAPAAKQPVQKKNSVSKKKPKKVQAKKVQAQPVKKEPIGYTIADYDSEFVYVYSKNQTPPPTKIYIVDDEEYYLTDFIEMTKIQPPSCSEQDVEVWKYQIKKDNSGIPIGGKFALDGDLTKFKISDEFSLREKQSNDMNCLKRGNSELDIVKCDFKSSFLVKDFPLVVVETNENRNENGEQVYNYQDTPELDFFGVLTINERDYFYLKSKTENHADTHVLTAEKRHLYIEKPGNAVCTSVEEHIESNIIKETSFTTPSETIEAYAIHKIKDGYIFIDSNELGYRGEPSTGDNKYKELLIVTDYGTTFISTFIDTVDGSIETSEEPVARRLWRYSIPASSTGEGIMAISDLKVKNLGFDRNALEKKSISTELKKILEQKKAMFPSLEIDKCEHEEYENIHELNCHSNSLLVINGKIIGSSSEDYSEAQVKLKTILEIKGKKYYLYQGMQKDGLHYNLGSEDGDYIQIHEGNYPTMC